MKVYVVYRCDYDDFEVAGVYSNRVAAEDHCRIRNETRGSEDTYAYNVRTMEVKDDCPYEKPKYVIVSRDNFGRISYVFSKVPYKSAYNLYGVPVDTIEYHGLSGEKLEEFIRKTLEKREKTEETDGNQ